MPASTQVQLSVGLRRTRQTTTFLAAGRLSHFPPSAMGLQLPDNCQATDEHTLDMLPGLSAVFASVGRA